MNFLLQVFVLIFKLKAMLEFGMENNEHRKSDFLPGLVKNLSCLRPGFNMTFAKDLY